MHALQVQVQFLEGQHNAGQIKSLLLLRELKLRVYQLLQREPLQQLHHDVAAIVIFETCVETVGEFKCRLLPHLLQQPQLLVEKANHLLADGLLEVLKIYNFNGHLLRLGQEQCLVHRPE